MHKSFPSSRPTSVLRVLASLTASIGLFWHVLAAPGAVAQESETAGLKCLFLGDQGHHQPARRFQELAPFLHSRGIDLVYTQRLTDLNEKNLKQYRVVIVYANIDRIDQPQADALLNFVNSGGGFVPLHCASFCFRNNPDLVALIGAQFKRHGTGVFRTEQTGNHPLLKGFAGFESWDETYVHHMHNEKNRTVLEYRTDREGREPWTWIRTSGKGRVFYTAWGHDARTWTNPGFQNLVERGIRWAAGQDPLAAGNYLDDRPFPIPRMKKLPADLKPFEFVDVGNEIPNYTPSRQWGTQGKPLTRMQKPLPPTESIKHFVVPEGFHVELFVAEPDLKGKPISMTWDARGRLWVAESVDYPNELQPPGKGRDRIRICEDTDGDGRADRFTVFAENLSIPTAMAFSRGGLIVQNGTQTLYLKDTDGDDRADERTVLLNGWDLGDTHGGVSNFQYGLDNWIWGMQGYNNSQPAAGNRRFQRFRMGFFRMKPDGSDVEFIRSTNNNTWGLGISEEGLIFGSTANGCPSVFMPIENRYYERVQGWAPSLTLGSIADSNRFQPITDKVRQVDHHGGYTAGAGHALYTAREYPPEYWNRVAFVNGPTGHLTGAFVLKPAGAGFRSTSPFNLLASDDEWSAPIMAEVGPDGQVWVIDWYNYIVQHNPTPKGFQTGKGRAYVTKLRDKKHGRIYRIVADGSDREPVPDLESMSSTELVQALKHPTMLIRKHAQRLLVEKQNRRVRNQLLELVRDRSVDRIGLNVGAIHALWTLHGFKLTDGQDPEVTAVIFGALVHPSAGVRRNALKVLPPTAAATARLARSRLHVDSSPQVRLATLLAYSDLPPSEAAAARIVEVAIDPAAMSDRWINDALTSAAARNSYEFLSAVARLKQMPDATLAVVERVANHFARSPRASRAAELLASLDGSSPRIVNAMLQGLLDGWQADTRVGLDDRTLSSLERNLQKLDDSAKGKLVKLASLWGSDHFRKYRLEISRALLARVRDRELTDRERIAAARQLVDFRPEDFQAVQDLADALSPQASPALGIGLLQAIGRSQNKRLGEILLERLPSMTPVQQKTAIAQMMLRPASTRILLEGIRKGSLALDDLALDQKQALAVHPDQSIRTLAMELLRQGGSLPDPDRQKVIDALSAVTRQKGNIEHGKKLFIEHCSKCHRHGEVGEKVGPDLTGMAVHSKEELLIPILDPSRNVEGNFRVYKVETVDGLLLTGMLASESKTAIELVDTDGKRKSILREDIERLSLSRKSVMPDGFEKSLKPNDLRDLLEFLTDKGRFIPLVLDKYATAISTRALFSNEINGPDQMVFPDWKPRVFKGVPFALTDPRGATRPNILLLHGPYGPLPPKMPKEIALPCNAVLAKVHFLGGVGGWNYPYSTRKTVSLIVQFEYADGKKEDHPLINGVHIADYIRRVDVPGSEFAFALRGQQVRYLTVVPKQKKVVKQIRLIKGQDVSSPIIMAVTLETASQ